jgi:hypothetical protein
MRMLTLTQEVIGWKHKGGKPCALKGASTVWGGGDATPERVNAPYSTDLSAGLRYTTDGAVTTRAASGALAGCEVVTLTRVA